MRSFIDRMTPKVSVPVDLPPTVPVTATAASRVIMVDLEPDLESGLEGEEEVEVECLSGPYRIDNHTDLPVISDTSHSDIRATPLLNSNSSSSSKKRKSPIDQGSSLDRSRTKSKTNSIQRILIPSDADTVALRSKGGAAVSSRIEVRIEKDKKEMSSTTAGVDAWICAACTYCHRGQERHYLQCAVCACSRPALSSQL